jgi:excisionase family DNA binding protein
MATELKVYTLEEIAELLHITRRTLYTYVKEGKLKAVKVGKYWRVTEKNLEAFLAKGTDA